MRAINLFTISRNIDPGLRPLYEKALSGRRDTIKAREEEIYLIRLIVDALLKLGVPSHCFENWFYSFTIPQIGKEFDLLKISADNKVINVELKSQAVTEEKIKKQLVQNRYYLSHAASKIVSFTCMGEGNNIKVYKYEDNDLSVSSFEALAEEIKQIDTARDDHIEELFKPKEYLISLFNDPESFLEGKYYLNNQQEHIKSRIIKSVADGGCLFGITGPTGTGKTLLLYDIARTLSKDMKVGMIHCGTIGDGLKLLDDRLENIDVASADAVDDEWLESHPVICVDETQIMNEDALKHITGSYYEGRIKGCILSYDAERNRKSTDFSALEGLTEERLTGRIRTNEECYYYIRNMLDLRDDPRKRMSYKNIDVVYANGPAEAESIVRFYIDKNYTFITSEKSLYLKNSDSYLPGAVGPQEVIGQEYDNVVIIMDDAFRYSEKGELEFKETEGGEYIFPRLFFQNISRTREKLCLIVKDNPGVFEILLKIKENAF